MNKRNFIAAGGSQQLVDSARGVLIFPSFVSAGFIVGGASGQGVLCKSGKSTGYFRMTEASVGLMASLSLNGNRIIPLGI